MEDSRIHAWQVGLIGEDLDLEDLPQWFRGSVATVLPDKDGYVLQLASSLVGRDYARVRRIAEQELDTINGIARVLWPGFRPVRLANRINGVDASGQNVGIVLAVEGVECRIKGGSASLTGSGAGLQPRISSPGRALQELARTSAAVADVLAITGRSSHTWSELYLVFELIESDLGSTMFTEGWITKAEKRAFCHTANSYSALGRRARHGRDRGQAPAKPMTFGEAGVVVTRLVAGWLAFKIAEPQELATDEAPPGTDRI